MRCPTYHWAMKEYKFKGLQQMYNVFILFKINMPLNLANYVLSYFLIVLSSN